MKAMGVEQLLFLCKVLLILWQCIEKSRGLSDEGKALLALRSSATAQCNRIALWESWDESDENPCAWVGVACTANSTVERLDFSGFGLSGFMDIDEQSLKLFGAILGSLKELDLSSNQLGGRIPVAVNSVKGLTLLDLSGNNFYGEIPATLSELRSLRYLSLERNQLNGSVPRLDGMADLQFVSFSKNQLTGAIPDLKNLSSLRGLDFSSNNLSGPIPDLASLPNLLSLDLSNNSLTGCIPSLETVPKLQMLYLANNRLGSGCAGNGSSLGEDDTLSLRASLRRVDVSHNQLEGFIPQRFVKVARLEFLDLSHNNLEGGIPPGIPSNRTNWINLSQNRLSGNIPPDLLNWERSFDDLLSAGCGKLRTPAAMAALQKTLNLSHNLLGGSIPGGPGVFDIRFDVLDLSHNQLEGLIPPISAQVLWLQKNRLLIGDIQHPLGSMTRELRLNGNGFDGPIDLTTLLAVGGHGNLEVLDLSDNLVHWTTSTLLPDPSGYPKMILEGLVGLRELRLAGNSFLGGSLATSSTGNGGLSRILEKLEVLDLSGSGLDGQILSQVVNSSCFPVLRVLDLSNNSLRGAIPASIADMLNLTFLGLSGNRLSGPLPDGLPPALLQKSFFANNPGLCGFPLPACRNDGIGLRLLLSVLLPSVLISLGSCLFAGWRWWVFKKKHQQDADLIATLLDRETVATLMPLRELKRATSNFSEGSQIGVGGFGTVHKGKLSDGTTVAIKKSKPGESAERDKQQFLNEVRILSLVNHQNLVKLLGCCLENKQSVLVFEFVSNGTLQEHLRRLRGSTLLWRQRLHIAAQTADALAYLHSAADPPIFHRDVKSANILLDDQLNAKVADFGISKVTPLGATHVTTAAIQGTYGYIDPEYFTTAQLTNKSDVYSFGVVLLELISAQPAVRNVPRGDEDASLVSWAVPRINRGDLLDILDPTLEETYRFAAGKESIEKLGRLAVMCLAKSKDRLTMREVCTELRVLLEEAPADPILVSTVDEQLEMSVYYTANIPGAALA